MPCRKPSWKSGFAGRVDLVGLAVQRSPASLISAVGLAAIAATIQAILAPDKAAHLDRSHADQRASMVPHWFRLFWSRRSPHSRNVVS